MRRGHGGMRALFENRRIEFQTDKEHVQDDSQLRNDSQKGTDGRRQNERGSVRAKQRGTKQNSRDHFAYDRRLAQVSEHPGQHVTQNDDGCERDEHTQKDVAPVVRGYDGFRTARRRRHQRFTVTLHQQKDADSATNQQAITEYGAKGSMGG